jgi:uncharacterized MAPEG superfamily protein
LQAYYGVGQKHVATQTPSMAAAHTNTFLGSARCPSRLRWHRPGVTSHKWKFCNHFWETFGGPRGTLNALQRVTEFRSKKNFLVAASRGGIAVANGREKYNHWHASALAVASGKRQSSLRVALHSRYVPFRMVLLFCAALDTVWSWSLCRPLTLIPLLAKRQFDDGGIHGSLF